MRVGLGDLEVIGEGGETVVRNARSRQENARQGEGVDDADIREWPVAGQCRPREEAHVEGRVMSDKCGGGAVLIDAGPVNETREDDIDRVGVGDHLSRDAREFGDAPGDGESRVHHRVEFVGDPPTHDQQRPDLGDRRIGPQTRGFHVDDDEI